MTPVMDEDKIAAVTATGAGAVTLLLTFIVQVKPLFEVFALLCAGLSSVAAALYYVRKMKS